MSYFAGFSRSSLLNTVASYNAKNIPCSIAFLPRDNKTSFEINKDVTEYLSLLDSVKSTNNDVTLKLSQFGGVNNVSACTVAITEIVTQADRLGVFVWIDAELPEEIDFRIDLYRQLFKIHKNIGICVQAYFKRTLNDVANLRAEGASVRLVKGFYDSNEFPSWLDVQKNYTHILENQLIHCPRFVVASHDPIIIEKAKNLIKDKNLQSKCELQQFMGVNDERIEQSLEEGFNCRLYAPYGKLFGFFKDDMGRMDKKRQLQRLFRRKVIV